MPEPVGSPAVLLVQSYGRIHAQGDNALLRVLDREERKMRVIYQDGTIAECPPEDELLGLATSPARMRRHR